MYHSQARAAHKPSMCMRATAMQETERGAARPTLPSAAAQVGALAVGASRRLPPRWMWAVAVGSCGWLLGQRCSCCARSGCCASQKAFLGSTERAWLLMWRTCGVAGLPGWAVLGSWSGFASRYRSTSCTCIAWSAAALLH